MSIYSGSHEGISEGRKGTWASAQVSARRQGRKFRAPEVLHRFRAIQRVGAIGAGLDSGGRRFRAGQRVRGPEVLGSGRKFRAFQKLVLASSSFSSSMLGLGPWILHGHLGCT